MKKAALLIAVTTLALTACSNSKEASEANFKESISRASKASSICTPIVLDIKTPDGKPAENAAIGRLLIQIANKDNSGNRINQEATRQMEALVDADMYKQESKENQTVGSNTIRVTSYSLTDKGAAQVQQTAGGPIFCIGHEEIEKVNWYTDPTPANGMTVSKVSYQAKFVPEKWAKQILKDDADNWKNLNAPQEKFATLVKTNTGWRDLRELR